MATFFVIVNILHTIGTTFGVGASTFALTFYISALMDGAIDTSEKRFLHVVYVMLRIGMTLIVLSLVLFFVLAYRAGATGPLPANPLYLMEWTLMAVIIVNAILMTAHKMPMSVGPVLAGGSWYSLFFISALPLGGFSYTTLLLFYAAFLAVFFAGFALIKNHFVKPARMVAV